MTSTTTTRRSGTQPTRQRARTEPARRPATKVAPARSATRPASRPPVRTTNAVAARRSRAGLGVFVALAIVFVLVSAVVFHVFLAQGQLELDHLDQEIAAARRENEQRRLEVATSGSPQRVIEEAQRLGLVIPTEPPTYLAVVGAKAIDTAAANPTSTLGDSKQVKASTSDTAP